jgi:hypothetical protein
MSQLVADVWLVAVLGFAKELAVRSAERELVSHRPSPSGRGWGRIAYRPYVTGVPRTPPAGTRGTRDAALLVSKSPINVLYPRCGFRCEHFASRRVEANGIGKSRSRFMGTAIDRSCSQLQKLVRMRVMLDDNERRAVSETYCRAPIRPGSVRFKPFVG